MASWQRLRLSLNLARDLTVKNVCWRCALRQTRRHSSTLPDALSGKEGFSQKVYDALVRENSGIKVSRVQSSQRPQIRKSEVDQVSPLRIHRLELERVGPLRIRRLRVDPSRIRFIRHRVNNSSPLVEAQSKNRGNDVHIGSDAPNREHEHEEASHSRIRHLRIPAREIQVVPVRRVMISVDGNKMGVRPGDPNPEADTAYQPLYPPKDVQDSGKSLAAAGSQISLDDVLQDWRTRMDKDTPLVRNWPTSRRKFGQTRDYTTSSVGELDPMQILISILIYYRPGIHVMELQRFL